ncbi:SEFIR domain-containing protein [Photobacterium swingsii]|uniref:toll/interleukin-1 receptor domain-containing protein n=1 Tax=Photobacterium swingsii TaxID=680026 RepID=UPI00066255FE|nr:toll/interleukin-1 receptor domain-containing protein [Photobacterium swingsii]KMV28345.1 SEFIR domain-containing protein [Photobacterium swingsii]
MVNNPKVFISYSHDNEEHKDWVYKLATDLMAKGIDTILDQWDLELGANLPKFMENGLHDSDRVLVVCTDNYNSKSNNSLGGVGFENTILTTELMYNQQTTKFIPIIRSVSSQQKTPRCLASRLYIDFSNDEYIDDSFNQLVHEIYGLKLRPKPKLGKNPFQRPASNLPSMNEKSTPFFHSRFSSAFPGLRSIEWFEGENAIERLKILLKQPLKFEDGTPIWWWGHGDNHISDFKAVEDNIALMNRDELKINKIAAVNCGSYYQSFVYVETYAMEPTGLYEVSEDTRDPDDIDYRSEEYAIFGEHLINRSEYDDGAAVIDGKPVDTAGQAELRVRYITPYNFIIAPHGSPINNPAYDQRRRSILKEIISGRSSVDVLADELLKLPRTRE